MQKERSKQYFLKQQKYLDTCLNISTRQIVNIILEDNNLDKITKRLSRIILSKSLHQICIHPLHKLFDKKEATTAQHNCIWKEEVWCTSINVYFFEKIE